MSLPTDGYQPLEVQYLINNSVGVSLSIKGVVSDQPGVAEELLSYLDTSLADFETAYETGSAYTVEVIKQFNGSITL